MNSHSDALVFPFETGEKSQHLVFEDARDLLHIMSNISTVNKQNE